MTLLRTENLSRRFGGLTAVDGVDMALEAGEIRAVIGPNGAGKTTLVGMICGRIQPSTGRIYFQDREITRLAPWGRVERGIAYTFQITSIFKTLSCFDNLALAVQRAHQRRARRGTAPDLAGEVKLALERVGLAAASDRIAGNLPYGHQRLLELALGLALEPKLLILDEPTQGLSEEEIGNFCRIVRQVAEAATVLLIEHNMPVVMELAQRITVMENGRILAEGTPAAIKVDAAVQRAYLGS